MRYLISSFPLKPNQSQVSRRRNSGIYCASLFKFMRTEVTLTNYIDLILFLNGEILFLLSQSWGVKCEVRAEASSLLLLGPSPHRSKATWGLPMLLQAAWFPCMLALGWGHSKPAGMSSGLHLALFPGFHMWLLCCTQWQWQNKSTQGFGLSCICCFAHCLNLITLATLDNGQQVEACQKQPSELAPTFRALLEGLWNCPTFSQAKTFHFDSLSKTNKPAEAVSSMQLDRFLKGKQ